MHLADYGFAHTHPGPGHKVIYSRYEGSYLAVFKKKKVHPCGYIVLELGYQCDFTNCSNFKQYASTVANLGTWLVIKFSECTWCVMLAHHLFSSGQIKSEVT